MRDPSVIHSTFVIERSYSNPPERVFLAFSDPTRKRRWFAEGDSHEVEEFVMHFRVGGAERLRYRFKAGTPFAGVIVTSEGGFLDIVPNKRIVSASTMSLGAKCISASLITIELVLAGNGTDLLFTHQGAFFEGADGPQVREHGWSHLFLQLSKELSR